MSLMSIYGLQCFGLLKYGTILKVLFYAAVNILSLRLERITVTLMIVDKGKFRLR